MGFSSRNIDDYDEESDSEKNNTSKDNLNTFIFISILSTLIL